MRSCIASITIIALLAAPVLAEIDPLKRAAVRDDFVPEPRLISPTAEQVDLTGEKELVFKWSPHEGARGSREYYDFRLYRGYDLLEGAQVVSRRVEPNTFETSVGCEDFADGETYTWSLRQVYDGARKSGRSTASFRVVKKSAQP